MIIIPPLVILFTLASEVQKRCLCLKAHTTFPLLFQDSDSKTAFTTGENVTVTEYKNNNKYFIFQLIYMITTNSQTYDYDVTVKLPNS
jgi:hypothetical protein